MKVDRLFSRMAGDYARYRPLYPAELYRYLARVSPGQELVWDCGTGNGQAARDLAAHFERVVATDASAEQIARAPSHERIDYRAEPAERVTLPSGSVDLVTVAIAVHWFDLERFYREVKRVLKPDGVIAVWAYHLPQVTAGVDAALHSFYAETVKEYWAPGIRYLDERYGTLPFPFLELSPPPFATRTEWDLGQLVGFLESWSASESYRQAKGTDPVPEILPRLSAAWGRSERRRPVQWPLHLRVGRVEDR